jgi:hypothetical protein
VWAGVWGVRVLLILCGFFLPSVAPMSQQDFDLWSSKLFLIANLYCPFQFINNGHLMLSHLSMAMTLEENKTNFQEV